MKKATVAVGIFITCITVVLCVFLFYTHRQSNVNTSGAIQSESDVSNNTDVSSSNITGNNKEEGILRGFTAPDFELCSINGNTAKLSDFKGKIVFLNFWTIWSSVCNEEFPIIAKHYKKYAGADDFVILSVNIGGNIQKVKEYIQNANPDMDVLLDSDYIAASKYNISSFPTTFIIDRDGRIYDIITGKMQESTIDEYIYRIKSTER